MKVKELIEILKDVDPEREIYMSRDSEGNGYNSLWAYDTEALYDGDGSMYDSDWSAADVDMDEDEWEEFKKTCKKVVCLWP